MVDLEVHMISKLKFKSEFNRGRIHVLKEIMKLPTVLNGSHVRVTAINSLYEKECLEIEREEGL